LVIKNLRVSIIYYETLLIMKILKLLVVSFFVTVLLSCEKEIHFTSPKIFIEPISPALYDTITNEMVVEVEIDGNIINPDRYEWEILYGSDSVVPILSESGSKIRWMPKDIGVYTVSCNVVAEDKSIKCLERYQIDFYPPILNKYLIGKWVAHGKIEGQKEWYSLLTINEDNTVETRLDSVKIGNVTSSIGTSLDDPLIWRYFYISDLVSRNNFSGTFFYSYNLVITRNIRFNSTFDSLNMEAVYDDFTFEGKDKPKIVVSFNLTKQ